MEDAKPFFEMSRRPPGMGMSLSPFPRRADIEGSSPVHPDAFCIMLLALRCMVRRISLEIRIGLGNAFLPDGNTLEIFARFVSHFGSLGQDSFDGKQHWICCA